MSLARADARSGHGEVEVLWFFNIDPVLVGGGVSAAG